MFNDMIQEFKTEAIDLFEEAEEGLLGIDKGEGNYSTHFNSVYRSFHSIKGTASMVNFGSLQEHMHKLETIFEKYKDKNSIEKKMIDYFLKGIDAGRQILNGNSVVFEYMEISGDRPLTNSNTDIPTDKSGALSREKTDLPPENFQLNAKKTVPIVRDPMDLTSLAEAKKLREQGGGLKIYQTKGPGKIFVVDDEAKICEIIKDTLQEHGHMVMTFTSARDALALIAQERPETIISDLKMPGLNGLDFLLEIKKIDPDLPLIFLSGFLAKDNLIEGLERGAFAFLEKPVEERALYNMVINSIEKYRIFGLLKRGIELVMYQYSDLDDWLKAAGRDKERNKLNSELKIFFEDLRLIREKRFLTRNNEN